MPPEPPPTPVYSPECRQPPPEIPRFSAQSVIPTDPNSVADAAISYADRTRVVAANQFDIDRRCVAEEVRNVEARDAWLARLRESRAPE